MTTTVKATYANGVLTPVEPLDLEEGEEVTVSIEGAQLPGGAHESLVEMFDRLRNSRPAGGVGRHADRWGQELQALPVRTSEGRRLMNVVFADAGYFIANLDNRDPLHERARTVAAGLGVV